MNSERKSALTVSFDGQTWQGRDCAGNLLPLTVDKGDLLPTLPDGFIAENLLFPVEMLLNRTFSLPLSHPRFIDAEILCQNVDDGYADQSSNWWFSWIAMASDEKRVEGVLFGLPESYRDEIKLSESWQQLQFAGADIQLRMQQIVTSCSGEGLTAVFDIDSAGISFALCRIEKGGKHLWKGMRRLNYQQPDQQPADIADEIRRSLLAMGWCAGEPLMSVGELNQEVYDLLALPASSVELCSSDQLPDRHARNFALDLSIGLNFRHGEWRAQKIDRTSLKPWYRTITLAVLLLIFWLAGSGWQNYRLSHGNEQLQARIVDAFHRGLPDQPVMIDAYAQLQKAAGSGAAITDGPSIRFLQHLAAVNRVYKQISWEMKEISFVDGRFQISGVTRDLATMSRIQEQLQQESGVTVTLKDSDLSGNRVKFRMVW